VHLPGILIWQFTCIWNGQNGNLARIRQPGFHGFLLSPMSVLRHSGEVRRFMRYANLNCCEGDLMYLFLLPSMVAIVVIGFIQLRDQFAVSKSS